MVGITFEAEGTAAMKYALDDYLGELIQIQALRALLILQIVRSPYWADCAWEYLEGNKGARPTYWATSRQMAMRPDHVKAHSLRDVSTRVKHNIVRTITQLSVI